MSLIERLRSWAQNEEMVNQHYTPHGRDCLAAADAIQVATKVRDAFHYDPGHSDLDNEQPIHIHITLGDWRALDFALRRV